MEQNIQKKPTPNFNVTKIFWIVSLVFSFIAGLLLLNVLNAEDNIDVLVITSLSLAIAVIPYCVARAVKEINKT